MPCVYHVRKPGATPGFQHIFKFDKEYLNMTTIVYPICYKCYSQFNCQRWRGLQKVLYLGKRNIESEA